MANYQDGYYWTVYNDYNGGDEVPCTVDLDTLEVVAFGAPTALRGPVPDGTFVEQEGITVAGREYDAIKTDEWNDAVAFGYQSDYNRDNLVLFDNDMLCAACGWN